jgi:preprotein translocase subunit SecF
MIDWMKYRVVYLIISGVVIGAGILSLFKWGLKLGVDFTGGSVIEYQFKDKAVESDFEKTIKDKVEIDPNTVQQTETGSYLFKFAPLSDTEKQNLDKYIKDTYTDKISELRYEKVGPSIGPELVNKTIIALLISAGSILLWVAYQFKSVKFGTSAVLGMFHDSAVLIGGFSLLGHFMGAEIDFLFVTALLTILSFSVHDTIVNYDRIRELSKKTSGDFYYLANKATTQTMVRSLNNSFTIIFMLLALVLMGGLTVRWFAVALLIGTISGTYSSPFVSVAILVTWDELEKRFKKI